MSDFEISMMNGNESSKRVAGEKKHSPREGSDGGKSDSGESDMSSMSLRDVRKSMKESHRGDIKGESTQVKMHHGDCAIEIDKEPSAGRWRSTVLTDFRQICGASAYRDNLLQALEMYGVKTPNVLQQKFIPVALHFLGKYIEGFQDPTGAVKSVTLLQGPAQGKTMAVILASLSVIDPTLQQPQAIFVSRSPKSDIDKLVRVLSLTNAFAFQAFNEDETGLDLAVDPSSEEALAARTAHVLIGHPSRLRKFLSCGASIPLEAVKVFVVDDAHEFFNGSSASSASPAATEEMRLMGLPSGERRERYETEEKSASTATTASAASAVDDVVEMSKMFEAGSLSKIPYFIIAEQAADKASKKIMKMLKHSMMIQKNLLSVESCTLPTRLIKSMKHYYAEAKGTDLVRVFHGLVQTLTFPRALVYCDDESIHRHLRDMNALGIAVTANLPGSSSDARQRAMQDFTSGRKQFLLTHSEPAVCQVMCPKVSCVFHFGLMSQMPSVYGVRLSPLDEKLRKESASILLVEPQKPSKDKAGDAHPMVSKLQKQFGIKFMDMPLDLLPSR